MHKWKYKPIERVRDEYGRILYYVVYTDSGYGMKFNTLKEARLMAAEPRD